MSERATSSPHISEVILQREMTRRDWLRGAAKAGVGLAGAGLLVGLPGCAAKPGIKKQLISTSSLTFTEIAKRNDDKISLALGYHADILLSWGDPLLAKSSAFDPKELTPEEQAQRFGYNNDFIAFFPLIPGSYHPEHGILCVNHEYTDLRLMFPHIDPSHEVEQVSEKQARIEMESLGCSVVEIHRKDGKWRPVVGSLINRRITATTPIRISGPAAAHTRMKTKEDPLGILVHGTMMNCAGGVTPWNTYLTCEENIDTVFPPATQDNPEYRNHQAMDVGKELYYGWHKFHDRFDTAKEPHEPNRFGWVVEIDPYRPETVPVKRTALGRMKHESASPVVAPDGRIAVFMGDDDEFEHVYRFLTARQFKQGRPDVTKDLLDDGVLSVAQFQSDGTVRWIPLVFGEGLLTPENDFHSQADVLIETRRAAKLMGATPMDRVEDVEVNPVSKTLFVVLTKNPLRTEKEPGNPRNKNPYGHILELTAPLDANGLPDYTADVYRWDIFLKGGNPASPDDDAYYQGKVSEHGWLTNPDNLAFDPEGRVWITTDGQQSAIDKNDSIYAAETTGPYKGVTRLFFNGPIGCEVTGPCVTPDGKTLFVSIQHPGEAPKDSRFDSPSTRWPDFKEGMPPRPSVIAITRKDGKTIGT